MTFCFSEASSSFTSLLSALHNALHYVTCDGGAHETACCSNGDSSA